MAKQAEAEGEKVAAIPTKVPGGINIRTLQTLEKISTKPSQKTLFVLPADLTDTISKIIHK
ncbi:MAG: domain / Band 7 family protein [Candidatus Saccharibacteria bacterium]|nr:domain / Band 7 family protein [Candidatus Saccharibacteria bacterium]